MKYLAFDIETASWPEDNDWDRKTSLGISCIGFMGTGWNEPISIYAGYPGEPEPRCMNSSEFHPAFYEMMMSIEAENQIVSWNGLQFDFLMMALENPENAEQYMKLAMDHIDPMFYILCSKGWPVSLNAVAHGLRLPGKMSDGVSGADAPKMWMEGTDEDRLKVLKYVGQDAKTTLDIVEVATRIEMLTWQSKSGRYQSLSSKKIPTVRECLSLPLPDTSWMDNPLTRESFYDWTKSNFE